MSKHKLLLQLESHLAKIADPRERKIYGDKFSDHYGYDRFCFYDTFNDEDVYTWFDPRQLSFDWEEWR